MPSDSRLKQSRCRRTGDRARGSVAARPGYVSFATKATLARAVLEHRPGADVSSVYGTVNSIAHAF
jgi:hypothetical protein